MKPANPAPRLSCEFDAFLFSPIGEDYNGLQLSVVSLLARRDLDPWQEAASLANLPKEAAIQKLASLIWALPGPLVASPDRAAMATRLIALLPRWSDSRQSEKPVGATAADAEAAALRRRVIIAAMIVASYIMLLAVAQLTTFPDLPSKRTTTVDAPASPETLSQTPPSLSEK